MVRKDAAFDADRTWVAIESALGGGFREWQSERRRTLARILLLDQFTRNRLSRHAARFRGDAEALSTAIETVDGRRLDRTLDRYERSFL